MTSCLLCNGTHSFKECPLFADHKTYLGHVLPHAFPEEARKLLGDKETFLRHALAPGEKPSPSLAPTLFEQTYGKHAEEQLQEVLDHPDLYSHDEFSLAYEILGGTKRLKKLSEEERVLLDNITHQLISAPRVVEAPKPERRIEDDEGPPKDMDHEALITGHYDPSDG
jgi:hypothetical protein